MKSSKPSRPPTAPPNLRKLEEEILIAHALGLTRAQLLSKRSDELDPALYQPLLDRRARHEPTAYITGHQPFMGLDFYVDNNVLIPRPETELLVEAALSRVTGRGSQVTIADIGTGSGCIAVSLAKFLPNAEVIGIDTSPAALEIAQKNAKRHQVADRCQLMLGNMFKKFTTKAPRHQVFDLIISNPPYIPTEIIKTLEPEVRDWEPQQALDGGIDGLDYVRALIKESPKYLKENGVLALEFGENQAEEIKKLAEGKFDRIEIIKDYAGIERIFIGLCR